MAKVEPDGILVIPGVWPGSHTANAMKEEKLIYLRKHSRIRE
jgi:hypothetical protein